MKKIGFFAALLITICVLFNKNAEAAFCGGSTEGSCPSGETCLFDPFLKGGSFNCCKSGSTQSCAGSYCGEGEYCAKNLPASSGPNICCPTSPSQTGACYGKCCKAGYDCVPDPLAKSPSPQYVCCWGPTASLACNGVCCSAGENSCNPTTGKCEAS